MVGLALDPPPSSSRHHSPAGPGLRRVAISVALLLAGAAGFVAGRWTAPGGRFAVTVEAGKVASAPGDAGAQGATATPSAPPSPTAGPTAAAAPTAAPAAAPTPATPVPVAPPTPDGTGRFTATLSGALEETIAAALPPDDRRIAPELTQVVNRLLVWDLAVAKDGRRGDRIDVVYSKAAPVLPGMPPSGEPVVEAVRFASQKLGRTFAAYRFQAEGSRYPRYYRADGSELEERLVPSPIAEYDQVTSLLRDGRRHKGVDFRTPVGTPVYATFDGVIERRNWNFAGNGNCLEVRDVATGRRAIYLHLDVLPKEMVPGRRVKKGEQIAGSGNSGRSFAPHLHYQLESSDGAILDPFTIHGTRREGVDAGQKAAFETRRAALEAALGGAQVAAR